MQKAAVGAHRYPFVGRFAGRRGSNTVREKVSLNIHTTAAASRRIATRRVRMALNYIRPQGAGCGVRVTAVAATVALLQ